MIIPTPKEPSIVILTGAGISAESGIATFRDHNGLWENHRIEDVATPEGFQRNRELVFKFYNERRKAAHKVKPNEAHLALAKLEKLWRGDFLLVTQNVDNLHEQAGSKNLAHMHGSLDSALCTNCGQHTPWREDIDPSSICPHCQKSGVMRPDIVWFGEVPYYMEHIEKALHQADYFIAIGTSGQVYPAAGFVVLAQAAGAKTIEINLEETVDHFEASNFNEKILGLASKTVPEFVEHLLNTHC